MYAVGLEHTGHHLWHDSLYSLLSCKQRVLGQEHSVGALIDTGLELPCAPLSRQGAVSDYLRAAVRRWRRSMLMGGGVGLTCLNSCSYPCGGAPWPRNPDVVALARASNAAQVDLRLLVLTREAVEIIYWFNERRVDALVDACTRMVAQLELLDPRFYACFDYNRYGDPAERERLSRFLGTSAVAKALGTAYQPTNHSATAHAQLRAADSATQGRFRTLHLCTRRLAGLCVSNETTPR